MKRLLSAAAFVGLFSGGLFAGQGIIYNSGQGVGVSTGITKAIAGTNITLTPASGIGEVTIDAQAGTGGGSASFFTFTENSGNKTAISSMTFESNAFTNSTSGSSITVRPNSSYFFLNASSPTVSGQPTFTSHVIFSSAAKFASPASGQPAVLIDAVSAGKGILKAGSSAGSGGGETQYFTGGSTNNFRTGYDGTANPERGFYIATPSTKALTITHDGRVLIGLKDTNGYASAQVHITTGAGFNGVLLMASTGSTNLFQVTSYGVSISSLQVAKIMLPAHLAATNSPSDQQVPKYDAATGKWTWSADNNSGGGGSGSSLSIFTNNNVDTTVRASTLVFIVTNGLSVSYSGSSTTLSIPTTAQMTITSATINQGLTVNSVTSTWVGINGAGAGTLASSNGQINIDPSNSGSPTLIVSPSSISLGSGDFIALRDKDRFTTPHFGSGTFVTYIATPTMGIASSTLGAFQFNNAISSQANFCVYPWVVPDDIDLTAPISLSSFGVVLGGADTGGQVYVISVATNQASSSAIETKFSGTGAWLSSNTVVIAGDSAGAAGDLETSTGSIVLGGWQTTLIPGQLHYVIVSRDGDHGSDTSTVNSYSSFFTISYRRRFYQ